MTSATHDGFGAPSHLEREVASCTWHAAAGDVVDRRAASTPRRSFEPTGTGDGKRTLSQP